MQVRPWLNLADKEFTVVQLVLVLLYSSVQVCVHCMPVGFRVVFKMVAPHLTAFHNVPQKCLPLVWDCCKSSNRTGKQCFLYLLQ